MSLSTLAAADRAATVDPTAGFGELVTYRPVVGEPREIYATVRRLVPQPVGPGAKPAAPRTEISVRHHATLGVTSIDRGADAFDVAVVSAGGEATRRQVVAAIGDAGGWLITLT